LPFCGATKSSLHAAHLPLHKDRHPSLSSILTVCLFVLVLWPLVCVAISAAIGSVLMVTEDWTYGDSFLRCLGTLSHTPSLAPPLDHRLTDSGKVVILLNAFLAVGITLGWTVGVCLLLPALGQLADLLSKMTVIKGDRLLDKSVNFTIVVLVIVPLAVLPLTAGLGLLLQTAEGWGSFTDSLLYVAGNITGIPLSTNVPSSMGGKILDFIVSCVGVGYFGFLIAVLGGLEFTDTCCEALGGKAAGRLKAVRFTVVFYALVMPIVCVAAAVPMGVILAATEGWSFGDGWLSAMSVLAQSPSLVPQGVEVKSDGGKIVVFLITCYALCVTIGWGAGLIVASKALGSVGDSINHTVMTLKAAARVNGTSKVSDGNPDNVSAGVAHGDPDFLT